MPASRRGGGVRLGGAEGFPQWLFEGRHLQQKWSCLRAEAWKTEWSPRWSQQLPVLLKFQSVCEGVGVPMSHRPWCHPQADQQYLQDHCQSWRFISGPGVSRTRRAGERPSWATLRKSILTTAPPPPRHTYRGLWPIDGSHAWHPTDLLLGSVQSSRHPFPLFSCLFRACVNTWVAWFPRLCGHFLIAGASEHHWKPWVF